MQSQNAKFKDANNITQSETSKIYSTKKETFAKLLGMFAVGILVTKKKKKKSTPTSNETEISNEINDFQTVHEL